MLDETQTTTEEADIKLHTTRINESKKSLLSDFTPEALVALRDARLHAGRSLMVSRAKNPPQCPPKCEDPFPNMKAQIPEVRAEDLTIDMLRGVMFHHGAIILRGFLDGSEADRFREMIDTVMATGDQYFATKDEEVRKKIDESAGEWFRFTDAARTPDDLQKSTEFMLRTGSIWTFLSPHFSHELTKAFEEKGIKDHFDNYFGDNSMLTFNKSVLRRVDPLTFPADWHQDGSFMGLDINSLNVWITLSECGGDSGAPGMDILPRRFNSIVPTGTEGAIFDWSVSSLLIKEKFADTPPVQPHFQAGDAMIFDHLNLHVSSYSETYTKRRYAIETWFFAQHYGPDNQIPVVW